MCIRGFAFADGSNVDVTLGHWMRLTRFSGGRDERQPPILVTRMPMLPPARSRDD
jgi:hypothetical protein